MAKWSGKNREERSRKLSSDKVQPVPRQRIHKKERKGIANVVQSTSRGGMGRYEGL